MGLLAWVVAWNIARMLARPSSQPAAADRAPPVSLSLCLSTVQRRPGGVPGQPAQPIPLMAAAAAAAAAVADRPRVNVILSYGVAAPAPSFVVGACFVFVYL